jgi:hypothetical protein
MAANPPAFARPASFEPKSCAALVERPSARSKSALSPMIRILRSRAMAQPYFGGFKIVIFGVTVTGFGCFGECDGCW